MSRLHFDRMVGPVFARRIGRSAPSFYLAVLGVALLLVVEPWAARADDAASPPQRAGPAPDPGDARNVAAADALTDLRRELDELRRRGDERERRLRELEQRLRELDPPVEDPRRSGPPGHQHGDADPSVQLGAKVDLVASYDSASGDEPGGEARLSLREAELAAEARGLPWLYGTVFLTRPDGEPFDIEEGVHRCDAPFDLRLKVGFAAWSSGC